MSNTEASKFIVSPVPIRIEIGKKSRMDTHVNKVYVGMAYLFKDILLIKEDQNQFEYEIPLSNKLEIIDTMRRGFSGLYVGSNLTAKIPNSEYFIFCSSLQGNESQWLTLLSGINNWNFENYRINHVKEIYLVLPVLIITSIIAIILQLIISLSMTTGIIISGLIVYSLFFIFKSSIETSIIKKIITQNQNYNIQTVDLENKDSHIFRSYI